MPGASNGHMMQVKRNTLPPPSQLASSLSMSAVSLSQYKLPLKSTYQTPADRIYPQQLYLLPTRVGQIVQHGFPLFHHTIKYPEKKDYVVPYVKC